MPIYKPSELQEFLRTLGIFPKKGLSQNFLIDGNIIRKIVKAAEIEAGDTVLEIGPGPGSLTEALLDAGAHVNAVEKDFALADALTRLNVPQGANLQVFCEDVMDFLAQGKSEVIKPATQKIKAVANLPYHLTTPIIAELVQKNTIFSSLTLMVQEEVARRFVASPGTSDYSSFTIFLEFYCQPKYAFMVSRNCFFPSPKVDSAVVVLTLRDPPEVSNREEFFNMVRTSFKQRRKMLRGSLKDLYGSEKVTDALTSIDCNPQARPEELSLTQFISLFEKFNERS